MSATSLMYWEGQHGKTQPRKLEFYYEINGAKDIAAMVPGYPALYAFDALTQDQIDDHLGTSSEFLAAQFDATAMGIDAFALIVRMGDKDSQRGQAQKAIEAKATLIGGSPLSTEVYSMAKGDALSSSTLEPGYIKGANGNLACRFVLTGLDAATSGILKIELNWISK